LIVAQDGNFSGDRQGEFCYPGDICHWGTLNDTDISVKAVLKSGNIEMAIRRVLDAFTAKSYCPL
jgi:hypothetical protein